VNENAAANTQRQSTVILSGKLRSDGSDVFQEIVVNHDTMTNNQTIIESALGFFRQSLGIRVYSADYSELNFYPISALEKVNLAIKKIVLPGNNLELPAHIH